MPFFDQGSLDSGPTPMPWIPAELLGPKVKPDPLALSFSYTTDTKIMTQADWVQLQVVMCAYQIHPATVAELATLGPVGGTNAKRWTIEGPLVSLPTDPHYVSPTFGLNYCTQLVEIAHSLTTDPGSDWRAYRPDRYRLRSCKARVTFTVPVGFDARLTRFAILATRIAPPQRPRTVQGVQDVVPSRSCRVVAHDFRIVSPGVLVIEDDAYLKII